MLFETKFDIWDEVTTILWDVWIITAIWIYYKHVKYCVWVTEDKDQWLYDWQIEKKKGNVINQDLSNNK